MWHLHITENHSSFKRNRSLAHDTTWMNLKEMIISHIRHSYIWCQSRKLNSILNQGKVEQLFPGISEEGRYVKEINGSSFNFAA